MLWLDSYEVVGLLAIVTDHCQNSAA